MTDWTFENTRRGYLNLWQRAKVQPGKDGANATFFAKKIIGAEARYREVEKAIGVPWYFVGALHMRESGCDFAGVLHNGERIIGTGAKTRLVPANRGPFATWPEAADDALRMKGFDKIKEWPVERMAYASEMYNGIGYVKHGVNSAYLWAGSTLEQLGKYVRDGVWDGSFDDPQIGTMTVLKRLCELRPDINDALNKHIPPVVKPPVKPAMSWLEAILSFFKKDPK